MINHNQNGAVSGLLISLILTFMMLLGAIGFGVWAFGQRQDYKDHADVKIASAAEAARQAEATAKTKEFLEKEKSPLKTYNGPEAYGSMVLLYPKTWSGYVDASGSGASLVAGYFSPGVVPAINDQTSVFALRVEVIQQPYAQVLESFNTQQKSGKGTTISAYALPKMPKVIGVKVSGKASTGQNDKDITMVVFPLRSQTLKVSTEGSQYLNDFNNYILPNFSFSP